MKLTINNKEIEEYLASCLTDQKIANWYQENKGEIMTDKGGWFDFFCEGGRLFRKLYRNERIKQMKEIRVYILDSDKVGDYRKLEKEEIQEIAERTGDVYSLEGFAKAFNMGEIYSESGYLFFIETAKERN